MTSFLEGLRNGARSAFCAIAQPSALLLQLGGNIYRGLDSPENGDDLVSLGNQVEAAGNVFCDRRPPGPDPAAFPVPFEGGQCEGAIYQVTIDIFINGNLNNNDISDSGRGPVGVTQGTNEGGGTFFFFTFDGVRSRFLNGGSSINDVTFGDVRVNRVDGGPDDCGDPPRQTPEFREDDWRTTLPVTYDGPGGAPQTENVTYNFGPVTINNNNGLTVPVEIEFEDGASLFGDVNLTTGDINIGLGTDDGGRTGNRPYELDDDQDPEELGVKVIGARVVCSFDPDTIKATEVNSPGEAPLLYFPRLAITRFKHTLPSGQTAWSVDYPVKSQTMVVWSPQLAVDVESLPMPGVVVRTFPIVIDTDDEFCC